MSLATKKDCGMIGKTYQEFKVGGSFYKKMEREKHGRIAVVKR